MSAQGGLKIFVCKIVKIAIRNEIPMTVAIDYYM